MSDNRQYSDALVDYHKARLESLSNPSLQCEGCQNPREFISTKDKLVFTCGSQGNGKCGVQYEVIIPHYTYFPQEYKRFYQCIRGEGYTDDIDDLSRYGLETTIKTFDFSKTFEDTVNESSEYHTQCESERKELIKKYQAQNNEESRIQKIHDMSRIRHTNASKRLKIQKQMKETDDPMQLSQLRKEYVDLFVNEREELFPIVSELSNDIIDDYVVIKDGSVKRLNTTYTQTKKPKKPRKRKPRVTQGS